MLEKTSRLGIKTEITTSYDIYDNTTAFLMGQHSLQIYAGMLVFLLLFFIFYFLFFLKISYFLVISVGNENVLVSL